MPTFLAPGFLLGGLAVAAAVALLHLLAWKRPPETMFPTARFVPDRPARAVSRALRPSDLLLLLLRVLVIAAIALAFAGPLWARREGVRRVILADVSGSVRDPAETADSVLAIARPGDVVVAFDSAATSVNVGDAAALRAALAPRAGRRPPGSLSAAIAAGLREATALRRASDSLELVVVSALAREETDAATATLREAWKGRARIVPVAPWVDTVNRAGIEAADDHEDPVLAAVALGGARRDGAPVRLLRRAATDADLQWARDRGGVLVAWPDTVAPAGWSARVRPDTVGAATTGDAVLVAPLVRRYAPAASDSSRAVAWWVDGEPAALEQPLGAGCLRTVAIGVPRVGDVALRPALRELVAALAVPCGGARDLAPIAADERRALAGEGPLLATAALQPARGERSPLVPWLLGAAIALALIELPVRARRREAA